MNEDNKKFSGRIKSEYKPLSSVEIGLFDNDTNKVGIAKLQVEGDDFPINYPDQTGSAKKAKSIDEMIEHLKQRLILKGSEESQLRELINEKMYFKVSYLLKLASSGSNFKVTYQDLCCLVEFDDFLRMSLNRLLPNIEQFAKSTLNNYLMEDTTDSEKYLDHSLYKYNSERDQKRLDVTMSKCATAIRSIKKNNEAVNHHIMNHGGHIPSWLFFDSLTFGQFNMLVTRFDKPILAGWLRQVTKNADTDNQPFEVNPKSLPEMLRTVQILRNTASHLARIYGRVFTYNPPLNPKDEYWEKINLSGDVSRQIHSLFSGLVVARFFYSCMRDVEIHKWNTFVDKLDNKILNTSVINEKGFMGFPKNWKEILIIKKL